MMAVAEWSGALVGGKVALEESKRFIATALGQAEDRASAATFIDGPLSSAQRRTSWMLADTARLARPCRIQLL